MHPMLRAPHGGRVATSPQRGQAGTHSLKAYLGQAAQVIP